MRTITVTQMARQLRTVLNQIEFEGEEVALVRNHHEVARIVPEPMHQTALEAMSDLYRTLGEETARSWLEDSRKRTRTRSRHNQLQNPWDT